MILMQVPQLFTSSGVKGICPAPSRVIILGASTMMTSSNTGVTTSSSRYVCTFFCLFLGNDLYIGESLETLSDISAKIQNPIRSPICPIDTPLISCGASIPKHMISRPSKQPFTVKFAISTAKLVAMDSQKRLRCSTDKISFQGTFFLPKSWKRSCRLFRLFTFR